MKKALAMLLSVLLLCAAVPLGAVSVAAEVLSGTTGDCTWTLVDGHLTISGEGKMADYDPLNDTVPWWNATSATIEEGVTHIGVYAFGHSCLTTVSIADSVSSIGAAAFVECTDLTSVTIPEGVTVIEGSTFYGCTALTSVTLPTSVTTINDFAFCESFNIADVYYTGSEEDRTNINVGVNSAHILNATWHYNYGNEPEGDIGLNYEIVDGAVTITGGTSALPTDLIIPDTIEGYPVTAIDRDAFLLCDFLTSVTIPDSVTTIGFQAFLMCRSLTSVTIGNNVTYIGWQAFSGCSSLTSVTIGDSVTAIDEGAFNGCSSLTSVTIPDSVTIIAEGAFMSCSSLTSVTIPDSVTIIGGYAFNYCINLTDVYYAGSEADYENIQIDEDNAHLLNAKWHYNYGGEPEVLSGTTGDCTWTLVDGHLTISGEGKMADYDPIDDTPPWRSATSLTIEEGVTHIGVYAFGHLALTTASIANSVSSIGNSAFVGCGSLTSVNIPDSVTAIEWSTFYGCTALTSITIPDSVTAIDEDAFIGCTSLASIILPSSITTIGESAFEECFSLTDVYYTGSDDDRTAIAIDFDNDDLLNATWHYNYGGEPEVLSGITGDCTWTLVDGHLTISGEGAMDDYWEGDHPIRPWDNSITSVTIEDGVTVIGDAAFRDCTSLTSVTISDSVTTIGALAFEHCTSLTTVTIPDSVTDIYGWAFEYCTALTSVTLGNGITYLCGFGGCTSLTSVTIPNSVTTISNGAFSNCDSLSTIVIPDSVTTIEWEAFCGCDNLTSIVLSDSVTTIESAALSYCPNLTDVYYTGSEADRENMYINQDNTSILNAKWHYNYGNEPEATFRYEVVNGTAAIVGCSDTLTGHIVIPDTIDGYIVTELWEGALNNRNITGVTLPTHLREFSPFCCYDAPNLATIEVPEENDYFCVVDGVLYSKDQTILCRIPPAKGISSYIVPDGVTQIEHLAFYPNSLSYLYLPKSVTYFGDANLNDDTVVEYGGSEEDRDAIVIDWWFNGSGIWHYNCPTPEPEDDIGLNYEIADGAVTITGFTDALPTELTIPDTIEGYPVTAIGDYAFFQCESLTSVTIPDSVTHLGESAFYCCTSLSSVTLGNGIATIGYGAFTNCNRLTAIVIPDSVTLIGERAFFECHSLASVTFGQGLISICDRAFVNCKALLSVEIPDSVTYLGEFAFSDCSSLRTVTLGSGITALYDGAFQGCSSLTSIVIPNSVTYVGNGKDGGVFEGCTSLTDVYYTGSEADRTLIEIETCNDTLLNATWHYNYGSEPEVAPGDANGDGRINNRDLGLLQQYLADWDVELSTDVMDVNGDGRVNNRDLGLIQQYLADWDVELK